MLSIDDYNLTIAALEMLKLRRAEIIADCDAVAQKIGRGEILCVIDRQYLALALQGHALHAGPESFNAVERIAGELGVTNELRETLAGWLAYSGGGKR
jgi:hypothetical protein